MRDFARLLQLAGFATASRQNSFARFAIEGMEIKGTLDYPEVFVDKDCRCYCQTCNKYVMLKKGDRIPPCCGKLMEIMD